MSFKTDVSSVLGLFQCVVVGDAADVSKAVCTFGTSATSCTTTQCNNPRTKVTSMINHW
jgi:hypothetical protein